MFKSYVTIPKHSYIEESLGNLENADSQDPQPEILIQEIWGKYLSTDFFFLKAQVNLSAMLRATSLKVPPSLFELGRSLRKHMHPALSSLRSGA